MREQQNFRTLLDCAARPGSIGRLERGSLHPPDGLHAATACAALALLGSDVSFYLDGMNDSQIDFLRSTTSSVMAVEDKADFLIIDGERSSHHLVDSAKKGTLEYPETSATLFLQVGALTLHPEVKHIKLDLAGPGIETISTVFVAGLQPALLKAVQQSNREFPLGIDTFLFAGDSVLAIPRTTKTDWSAPWDM